MQNTTSKKCEANENLSQDHSEPCAMGVHSFSLIL